MVQGWVTKAQKSKFFKNEKNHQGFTQATSLPNSRQIWEFIASLECFLSWVNYYFPWNHQNIGYLMISEGTEID